MEDNSANIIAELMQKMMMLEKTVVSQLDTINKNISALNSNSKIESLENKLEECAIRANEQILDLKLRIHSISESMTTLQTKKSTKSKAKPVEIVSVSNDSPQEDDTQETFVKLYLHETRSKKPGLATSIVEKYTTIDKKLIPNIFAANKTLFDNTGDANAKIELLAKLIYTKFAPEDREVFITSTEKEEGVDLDQ
jgi:hypothetical protein